MTPTFGTFFQNVFVVKLCCKLEGVFQDLEGFFRRSRRLLPKSDGFTHTYVSETRCSFAYGSSRAAFVSSGAVFVTAKQHSNGNGFHKLMLVTFIDTYHSPLQGS